jgi:N-acetylmuramoyl-L-alanine amidase
MRRPIAVLATLTLALAAAAPAAARTQYVVRYGDTLTGIAAAHGLSLERLAHLNHRRAYAVLPAGTVLVVPGRPVRSHGGGAYRVRFGDTLSGIAARFGMSVNRLAQRNGLDPRGILLAGSTLRLPAGGPAHRSHGFHGRYRVAPGDTLTGIAARFGVGIHRLARANGLRRNGILLAGITLRVPAHARVTPSVPMATGPWSVTAAIDAWSAHYGVDPALARAISWEESGFQIDILSSADAWGPMQVTPGTWRYVEDVLIGHPVARTGDGDIRIGVALLHHLIADFGGNTQLAVAAYYQGERSVRAVGMFPETVWYVDNVMALRGRV